MLAHAYLFRVHWNFSSFILTYFCGGPSADCGALTKVKWFVYPISPQKRLLILWNLVHLVALWLHLFGGLKTVMVFNSWLFLIVRVGRSILWILTSFVEVGQLLFECLLYARNWTRPYLSTLHHDSSLLTSPAEINNFLATFLTWGQLPHLFCHLRAVW